MEGDNSKCNTHIMYEKNDCYGCRGYLGGNEREIRQIFNEGYIKYNETINNNNLVINEDRKEVFKQCMIKVMDEREDVVTKPIDRLINERTMRMEK